MIADTTLEKIAECRRMVFDLTEQALDAMRNHQESHAVDCLAAASKYAAVAAEYRAQIPEHEHHHIPLSTVPPEEQCSDHS